MIPFEIVLLQTGHFGLNRADNSAAAAKPPIIPIPKASKSSLNSEPLLISGGLVIEMIKICENIIQDYAKHPFTPQESIL